MLSRYYSYYLRQNLTPITTSFNYLRLDVSIALPIADEGGIRNIGFSLISLYFAAGFSSD